MTKINQTSLADPIVPQGGAILETVIWDASVPSGTTFPFKVYSAYGNDVDGTPESFQESFYGYAFNDIPLTGPLVDARQTTLVGYLFESDAPIGTYDCLTIIGYEESGVIYILDWTIDLNVLTIEQVLAAGIVSTSFSKV